MRVPPFLLGLLLLLPFSSTCQTVVQVKTITVTSPSRSLAVGTPVQLTAIATYADNSIQQVTGRVSWSSLNAQVATVASTGVVTPTGAGTGAIVASFAGVTSSILSLPVTSPVRVVSVSLSSSSTTCPSACPLHVMATFSNGTTSDVSTQATFVLSTPAVASVTNGVLNVLHAGTTTITTSYGGLSSNTITINTPGIGPIFPSIPSWATFFSGMELTTTGWNPVADTAETGGAAGASVTLTVGNKATQVTPGGPGSLKFTCRNPVPNVAAGGNCLAYQHFPCSTTGAITAVSHTNGPMTVIAPLPILTPTSITIPNITATTTASQKVIIAVQVYDNGVLVLNTASVTPHAPYTYTASNLSGVHNYVVTAYDSAGNSSMVSYAPTTFNEIACSAVTDIVTDDYEYVPSTTDVGSGVANTRECIEKDPDSIFGGWANLASIQVCTAGATAGHLNVWDSAAGANGQNGWVPTGHLFAFTPDVWSHVQIHMTLNQALHTTNLTDVFVNGMPIIAGSDMTFLGVYSTGTYGTLSYINNEFQIDNQNIGTGNSIYLDKMHVYVWGAHP